MKLRILGVAALAVSVIQFTGWAGTTGKISGTLVDSRTREPLIGANVVVKGTSTGSASNLEGYYVILNVPPGTYTLTASAVGYHKKIVTNVSVSIDLTTTIDIELLPSVVEVGEEIVVTADRPIIRKDLTSSESRVDATQIESLPVNEVSEVLTLQAGITRGADGGIHIRGGRTSEVAYWVDGVSISDAYDGSQAVRVENNAVQELQVISGTFNAEYGEAMSGIVNIVTKEGGQSLHGSLSAYSGDYVTSDGWSYDNRTIPAPSGPAQLGLINTSRLFYGLDKIRPFEDYNIEGSLSGPIPLLDGLTFYASGRYFRTKGWLFGYNLIETTGAPNPESVTIDPARGLVTFKDNLFSMNGSTRTSGQTKLTYQFSGSAKLSLSGIASTNDFRDYNHDRILIPESDVQKFDRGYNVNTIWNQTLGTSAFFTVNLSYFFKDFKEYLYESPTDPRYFYADEIAGQKNNYEFIVIGPNNHHFKRKTETRNLKIDYTDQVSPLHQLKVGVEGKLHSLYLEDYNVTYTEGTRTPGIPEATGPLYEEYTRRPVELSAYVQDKLEYERMIVNVGLRLDYFDSKGKILADRSDPNVYLPRKIENQRLTIDERLSRWYKKASVKYALSPRFGISYPITDKGILHFSYGHFLQIPSFLNLYVKPDYKVTTASGVQGVYGNPDLKSQKTVMYEFGLQQELTDNISFDITGFYRDTRDWVTTSPEIPVGDPGSSTSSYVMYINRDYANTRGVTVTLNKRALGDLVTVNLAYMFQNAEGINSNPDDARAALVDNKEPSRSLTPLDWDQTHTANLTVGIGKADWGVFLLGRYGSGLPYTPSLNQADQSGQDVSRTIRNNSRRRPPNYTFDVRAFKSLEIGPVDVSLFVKVFNLLDRRNEITVFGTTGRATSSVRAEGAGNVSPVNGINSVEEFLVRPDYYSEPRKIQFGIEMNF